MSKIKRKILLVSTLNVFYAISVISKSFLIYFINFANVCPLLIINLKLQLTEKSYKD